MITPIPDPNPSGLCMCGCDEPVGLVPVTHQRAGYFRGNHLRFIPGHQCRKYTYADTNPSGLCKCGCGKQTTRAKNNDSRTGAKRGSFLPYVFGHWGALSPVEYLKQDCGYETPCWVWQKALDSKGYGQLRVDGRLRRAPRAYYERLVGPIPEGLQIDHLCRNHACVNPAHLEPVTGTENQRRGTQPQLSVETARYAKRELAAGRTQQSIATELGVHYYTIGDVKRGVTWKDVV